MTFGANIFIDGSDATTFKCTFAHFAEQMFPSFSHFLDWSGRMDVTQG